MVLPATIQNLITEFARFPGIGPKTSERLVFWLLRQKKDQIAQFISVLNQFKQNIHLCKKCFCFNDNSINALCDICVDKNRDQTTICVVADQLDVLALEQTNYQGLYHILGGVLNPLQGINPKNLRIKELIARIKSGQIKEIILGFDPNQEGEMTCHHLKKVLQNFSIKITRLGRGLPQGGDLDYADEVTLTQSLAGRREF